MARIILHSYIIILYNNSIISWTRESIAIEWWTSEKSHWACESGLQTNPAAIRWVLDVRFFVEIRLVNICLFIRFAILIIKIIVLLKLLIFFVVIVFRKNTVWLFWYDSRLHFCCPLAYKNNGKNKIRIETIIDSTNYSNVGATLFPMKWFLNNMLMMSSSSSWGTIGGMD